jgi:hypothetical protein
MPEEDVLDEVRRVREELARECNSGRGSNPRFPQYSRDKFGHFPAFSGFSP